MSLKAFFLESPWLLLASTVSLEIVLVHLWLRRRTRWLGRAAIGGLIAIPLLATLQAVVVTDRESVINQCWLLAHAVRDGDLDIIGNHLSDELVVGSKGRRWTRDSFLKEVEQVLSEWDVQEERLGRFTVIVTGDRASIDLQASCRLISSNWTVPMHISRWHLGLLRSGDQWLVAEIRPQKTRTGLLLPDWLR